MIKKREEKHCVNHTGSVEFYKGLVDAKADIIFAEHNAS